MSPQNEIPARRMRPLRQSTLDHGRYVRPSAFVGPPGFPALTCERLLSRRRSEVNASKAAYSHVASWADRYLDSGVSLTMDMAGSDYDSEDSSSSHETVHHSYSYIPSDAEVRGRAGCNRNWLKSSRKGRSDLCFFFPLRFWRSNLKLHSL